MLEAVALEDADLGGRRFDKVFAFNVAPFWQQPEAALGVVREHLARDGAVYIFWDARHSAPERARDLGNELADRLREGGFSVDRVLVEDLRPVPAVCAIGGPRRRSRFSRVSSSRSGENHDAGPPTVKSARARDA